MIYTYLYLASFATLTSEQISFIILFIAALGIVNSSSWSESAILNNLGIKKIPFKNFGSDFTMGFLYHNLSHLI